MRRAVVVVPGAALLDAMEAHGLPAKALISLVEARIFDLYNDPMPDRASLEGYLGETASALFQLSTLILDAETGAKATEASGSISAFARVARSLPHVSSTSPPRHASITPWAPARGPGDGEGRPT